MSRVLHPIDDGIWFHELRAVAYYGETELEKVIRSHLVSLFPDFFVFPFKQAIRKGGETKKPDLAMIRRDFQEWGIIEVETEDHNLAHVLEQTNVFIDGDYNVVEAAKYIRAQMKGHCNKRVSQVRIQKLLESRLPKVLVIVDAEMEGWDERLKASGVDLCIFQIFKSPRGSYMYRTFGKYPVVPSREVHCRLMTTPSNLLEITGEFHFQNLRKNKHVDVVFDSSLTRWALIEDDGKKFLRFLGKANPLSPNATYRLYADRAGKYYFAPN
jgi:hypothetical protein